MLLTLLPFKKVSVNLWSKKWSVWFVICFLHYATFNLIYIICVYSYKSRSLYLLWRKITFWTIFRRQLIRDTASHLNIPHQINNWANYTSTAHPSRAHLYPFLRPQPPPIHNSPVHSSPLRNSPFHSSPVHNHPIHNSLIQCSPIHNSCRWRKASVGSGGLLFCYLKNGLKIRNLHRKLRQEIENNSM